MNVRGGCLFLCALVAVTPGANGAAASSIGISDAQRCFEESRRPLSATGIEYCNNALRQGDLTRRDEAATLSNRGIIQAATGRFREAMADHERAISMMPDMGLAYVNRGNTYFRMREFENALADFDRAIELDARPADVPHFNKGLTYLKLERRDDALASFRQALAINPESHRIRQIVQQLEDAG